jgi:hypothetical protein
MTYRNALDGENGVSDEKGIVKSPGRFGVRCLFTGKAQVVEKTPSDRGPVEDSKRGRDSLS